MKCGVFKNTNNELGERVLEGVTYESLIEAKAAILAALAAGTLPGAYGDYLISPFDAEGKSGVPVDESELQVLREQTGLLFADSDVAGLLSIMRTGQQLFNTGLAELNQRLTPEAKLSSGQLTHPLLRYHLLRSEQQAAAQQFSELEMLEGLVSTAIPALRRLIDTHLKQDQADERADAQADEVARRAVAIPVAIAPQVLYVDRKGPVVLCGPVQAVNYLLMQAANNALCARPEDHPLKTLTVAHLRASEVLAVDANARYIRFPKRMWAGLGTNRTRVEAFATKLLFPRLPAPVDLLLIDDLAAASLIGVGGAAYHLAAAALDVLWKWCERAGMACLAAIPDPNAGQGFVREIAKLEARGATVYRVALGPAAAACDDQTIYVDPAALAPASELS